MSVSTSSVSPFGAALRQHRATRGLSQLELSAAVGTPSRHVSFLETGRSRPSRVMVERISDALRLPLRERNRLLASAGLAQAYTEQRLDETELAVFRSIIDRVLERHAPYPGYVLDGHWNIVRANPAAAAFLPEDGERNLVRLMYTGAWRDIVVNWHEIAWPGIRRLQDDAERFPADEELGALVRLAVDQAAGLPHESSSTERVLCPVFRSAGTTVRTVSVLAQFTAPRDVTLDELRIELLYPADDEAEQFFRALESASTKS